MHFINLRTKNNSNYSLCNVGYLTILSRPHACNPGDTPGELEQSIVDNTAIVIAEDAIQATQETNNDESATILLNYNEICDVKNLERGLARTKSNVSVGLDGEVKANYTTGKLEKLAADLKSQKFSATPIKKV
jgi:hypothetical protein